MRLVFSVFFDKVKEFGKRVADKIMGKVGKYD